MFGNHRKAQTNIKCGFPYYFPYILAITILMANTCLTAPTHNESWWLNPCDNDMGKIRHGRSADQHLIINTINVVLNDLRHNIIKDLHSLYKEITKTNTIFKGKFPWLKLKKMLNQMRHPLSKSLNFHEALQFFAGTVYKLKNIKIKTNATRFREHQRQRVYQRTTSRLKLLLCEVEYSIQNDNQTVPTGISLRKMKIALPQSLDLTGVHILDVNFFQKIETFLKRSKKLFKNPRRKRKFLKRTKSVH